MHREHFDPAQVQVSTLLSVKTGGCPEDCAYCPQAQRYSTGVNAQKLMETDAVLAKARQAKAAGASRFCMGAAWRSPKDRDIPKVAAMIAGVKALGLETCATLGMLSGEQARALKDAGLDYYNHNLDTAPDYYDSIIHTRQYQDRLDFDKAAWKTLQSEARDREAAGLAALKPVIHGSDIDPTAIQAARENAEVAGVAHAIRFTRADVADLAAPEQEIGAVVCNPPYDERLAADPALYRALGTALQKAVPQWRASLLCGNDELAFATGLRASKKYQMFNGALECALIVCDPIAVPGRDPAQPRELSEGAQMVANRLRKNLKKFKSWRAREHITCFRAYDADLPEYAAAIDVYEEDGGKRRTFLHVQEYAAPAAIPENDVRRRRNELLAAAREVFGVPPEQVSMKSRERGKGGSKYGRFEQRDEFIVVRENNALLQVNLFDYLDTGLFLDHRPLRRMMAEQVRGKRFLNLFCYTGVASVQAAVAGAASTTSVDLSATYLQWCYDNLALNGQGGNQHLLVQADAMAWLEGDRGQYDVIFCDPPTFSNSARADDFDVQREQLKLLRAAVARLAPGGVLYFSNNFRRFKLEENAIAEFAQCREITARTIGPDFERNARIHRAWELKRLG
ncbi:hypothetical protein BMR86_00320 [Stenotrophomonas sp. KAs 5-3]|nr:hypothetical protein BMR86_06355 [Stenotrophomonas sp. KAs 5-3]OMP41768.1 hypothetical protein BMR86_00320 [Stenotrophomonas sp. KAs 5-3]